MPSPSAASFGISEYSTTRRDFVFGILSKNTDRFIRMRLFNGLAGKIRLFSMARPMNAGSAGTGEDIVNRVGMHILDALLLELFKSL